jgi:hypothetical protein
MEDSREVARMGLKEYLEKLTDPLEELETERIRSICLAVPGVTPIVEIEPRNRYKIAGLVRNMRIEPKKYGTILEITVTDGTGLAKARWTGRARIPGIDVSKYIVLEGHATAAPDGSLVFINPFYELLYVE